MPPRRTSRPTAAGPEPHGAHRRGARRTSARRAAANTTASDDDALLAAQLAASLDEGGEGEALGGAAPGTPADDEQVASFCAVTGAEPDAARHFLAAAAGDLEQAVSLFLDGHAAAPAAAPPPPQSPEVRAPIRAREDVLVSDSADEFGAYSPFSGAVARIAGAFGAPLMPGPSADPFRSLVDDSSIDVAGPAAHSSARRRRLADIFRVPSELVFSSSVAVARREGVRRGAWILLCVHEPTDFGCQQLVRDVWRSDAFSALLEATRMLFVFLTAGTAEAARYAQYYPFGDAYPHYALVDPRTGQRVLHGPPPRASNAEPFSPDDIVAQLASHIAEHPIDAEDAQDAQQSYARAAEVHPPPPAAPDATPLPNEAAAAALADYGEPPAEPAAGDADACTLQLRLPDGRRVRRRFRRSDNMRAVFAVVGALAKGDAAAFEVMYPAADGSMQPLSATASSVGDLNLHMATLTVVPL